MNEKRPGIKSLFQATAGTGLCGGDALSDLFCKASLPDMLNGAFQIAISVGAILAMLRIAYGGYLYMGSADMWSSKQHAKEVFRDAVIGLLLLLAIYLILYQINPCILNLDVLNTGQSSEQCRGQNQSALPGGVPGAQPF